MIDFGTQKICKDCKSVFIPKYEYSTRCYDCYKIFKAKTTVQVIQDNDGIWLRNNVKNLLSLCHPDKHHNCNISNEITKKLIIIYQSNKGASRG